MKNKSNDKCYDAIVNLTIAFICGIMVAFIFMGISLKAYNISLWFTGILGIIGFIIGSAYGFWHAYIGWKNSDNKAITVDDFKNLLS